MSPEQARGEPVDARSVFSFGVVLYELLTGRHPFRRDTTLETAAAILGERPEPMRRHRPELPAPLDDIADRMLAPVPDDRYQPGRGLSADLVRVREVIAGAAPAAGDGPQDTAALAENGASIAGEVETAPATPRSDRRLAASRGGQLRRERRTLLVGALGAVALMAVAAVAGSAGAPTSCQWSCCRSATSARIPKRRCTYRTASHAR